MRIAGLASRDGSTLLRLHDRAPGDASLAVVASDDEEAPVLEGAAERGIPTETVGSATGSSTR